MSIEQVEAAILSLSPQERRRLLHWFERHRDDLFGRSASADDLSQEQKAEILKRRREYDEHPERFISLDEARLDDMFARIRGRVAAPFPSAS